jgi:hypothetical protein
MTHALHPTLCRFLQMYKTSRIAVESCRVPPRSIAPLHTKGLYCRLRHHLLPQSPHGRASPVSSRVVRKLYAYLPLPLKVGARGKESDTLIHDRLADPEVVFEPFLDARVFAELIWLHTGSGLALAQNL